MYVCNPRGTEIGHSLGLADQPTLPALGSFRPMRDLVCFKNKVDDASQGTPKIFLWPPHSGAPMCTHALREYGCDEKGKCGR